MHTTIELVPLSEVYPLRHKILRAGQALETCYYPEDSLDGVFHLAAYSEQPRGIVAIASFYPEAPPELHSELHSELSLTLDSTKAFRLRGMACDKDLQGQGIGSKLLIKAIDICQQACADLLWCNARSSAYSFYNKLGFQVYGESFDIEGIGEHFIMFKQL